MKKIFDKQKPMKNKIIMKNKKFRFVFKDVDDEKFRKVHKYLTHLKDISSVKKMINMKKKFEKADPNEEPEEAPKEAPKEAPEPEEDYSAKHEDYEKEYYD